MGVYGFDSSGVGEGQLVGFCEHSDELSASVRCDELIEWLRKYWVIEKESAAWKLFTVISLKYAKAFVSSSPE
jgi:hypothetical protein